MVDGQEGKQYDGVGSPVFSPDGTRLAYLAKQADKWLIVVDGVDGKLYDDIRYTSLTFSPDGQHVAYDVKQAGEEFVVVDGVEGKQYTSIMGKVIFDSAHNLHYLAQQNTGIYLVEDVIK